jgi:taurine dioxygenase
MGHRRASCEARRRGPGPIEIGGLDLSHSLSPELFSQIRAAWLEHLVIRIRGQKLSDPQLLAFSRNFGELDPPGPNPLGRPFLADHPEMNVISNIKRDGVPIGGLGDGEAIWHADMTYVERPPMAAILYAIEIPPAGGDTYWANMHAAYDTLPEPLKRRIEGLEAIDDATYNSAGTMRKGYGEVTDPRTAPGARHPLVRTHPETGRRSLFLGRRRNSCIVGLDLSESENLLDTLWAHIERPDLRYQHRWRVGDLLLWDNRSTMHRRDPFDNATRRVMHRTQIKGKAAPREWAAAA